MKASVKKSRLQSATISDTHAPKHLVSCCVCCDFKLRKTCICAFIPFYDDQRVDVDVGMTQLFWPKELRFIIIF